MSEQLGKVAVSTVDALKQQPVVLALIVLQALVLAAVLYNSLHRQSAIDKQFGHVFELLGACIRTSAVPLPLPRPQGAL